MSSRTLVIIAGVLGGLLFISLVFTAIFGVQLAGYSGAKKKEIQTDLDTQAKQLKADFQASLEQTTTTYTASDVFGSFQFAFPKVWSTNVAQEAKAATALTFLADPNLIVQNKDEKGPFTALRVEVYNTGYDTKVKDTRNKYITNAKKPYKEADATVSGLKGKKYTGNDSESGKDIVFYIVPLRDKTLYIGTDDASKFANSLETIVKTFSISK